MILAAVSGVPGALGFPRVSGGDPCRGIGCAGGVRFSPRERG